MRVALYRCHELHGLDVSRIVTDEATPDPGSRSHNHASLWTTYNRFDGWQGDNIYASHVHGVAWISDEDVAEFFGDWNEFEVRRAARDWLDHEIRQLNLLPEVIAWQEAKQRQAIEERGPELTEVVAAARSIPLGG